MYSTQTTLVVKTGEQFGHNTCQKKKKLLFEAQKQQQKKNITNMLTKNA